jgi:hypothetical protein
MVLVFSQKALAKNCLQSQFLQNVELEVEMEYILLWLIISVCFFAISKSGKEK